MFALKVGDKFVTGFNNTLYEVRLTDNRELALAFDSEQQANEWARHYLTANRYTVVTNGAGACPTCMGQTWSALYGHCPDCCRVDASSY